MAGLYGFSQAVLEGSLQVGGSERLNVTTNNLVLVARTGLSVRAQQQGPAESETTCRRVPMVSLVGAGLVSGWFAKSALAEAIPIKVGPPPPPPPSSEAGTLNADQARDRDLPLKERFYLQHLPPLAAAAIVKESVKDIIGVKGLINKKAWTCAQTDFRLKAEYLRYDLNTLIAAKSKEEKKPLKELTGKLFQAINTLDHAAKIMSTPEAEKYFAETASTLNDVLAKIG